MKTKTEGKTGQNCNNRGKKKDNRLAK